MTFFLAFMARVGLFMAFTRAFIARADVMAFLVVFMSFPAFMTRLDFMAFTRLCPAFIARVHFTAFAILLTVHRKSNMI